MDVKKAMRMDFYFCERGSDHVHIVFYDMDGECLCDATMDEPQVERVLRAIKKERMSYEDRGKVCH